jgi:hypothetical protein
MRLDHDFNILIERHEEARQAFNGERLVASAARLPNSDCRRALQEVASAVRSEDHQQHIRLHEHDLHDTSTSLHAGAGKRLM